MTLAVAVGWNTILEDLCLEMNAKGIPSVPPPSELFMLLPSAIRLDPKEMRLAVMRGLTQQKGLL